MQSQPKSSQSRSGRVQRVQALRNADDTFKGGATPPRTRLGLKRPWLVGMSRLFKGPEPGADSE